MKRFDVNFKLLLVSKVISIIGGNIKGFATLLFIVAFTGSASILGIITAVSMIPRLVFGPIAGMVADRLNKKYLIILFDFLTTLNSVVLLLLIQTGTYTVLNIAILSVIGSTISTFAGPAFSTAVPQMVKEEELTSANGTIETIGALGMIGGSIFGGVLFGIFGMELIALGSVVMFLISTLINFMIKIPYQKLEKVGNVMTTMKYDMKESLAYIKNENPFLLKMSLLVTFISMVIPPIFNVGLPFIVATVFDGSSALSFGIASLGMLLGGIFSAALKKFLEIHHLPLWFGVMGFFGLPLALAVQNQTVGFWIFNLSLFGILFVLPLIEIIFSTYEQKNVPSHLLGKVGAFTTLISNAAGPLGMLAVGIFIETMDLSVFFVAITLIMAVVTLLAVRLIKANGHSQRADTNSSPILKHSENNPLLKASEVN